MLKKLFKYINPDRKGATLKRLEDIERLGANIQAAHDAGLDKRRDGLSLRDITPDSGVLSRVPIRATVCAPEYYGGVRIPNTLNLPGVRGHGDIVCQPDQVGYYLAFLREHNREKIKDIICDVSKNTHTRIDVDSATHEECDRFLDLYQQPYDDLYAFADDPYLSYVKVHRSKRDPSAKVKPHEINGRSFHWPDRR